MKRHLVVATALAIGLATTATVLIPNVSWGSSRPAVVTSVRPIKTVKPPPLPAVIKSPKGTTLIASITTPTPYYRAPFKSGSPKPLGIVPVMWHNSHLGLPVIGQQPGWLDVRLPQRPNGLTGWMRSTAPALSYTGYSVTINVTTMHLSLFSNGVRILNAPAGVGAVGYPTPLGHFFVAYFAEPPSSGYGPFVIVTSAHSNTITDWEASGDAEIGIHGPLGMDAAIGATGARISHGCVRLHVSALVLLRNLPLGTPVTITA